MLAKYIQGKKKKVSMGLLFWNFCIKKKKGRNYWMENGGKELGDKINGVKNK